MHWQCNDRIDIKYINPDSSHADRVKNVSILLLHLMLVVRPSEVFSVLLTRLNPLLKYDLFSDIIPPFSVFTEAEHHPSATGRPNQGFRTIKHRIEIRLRFGGPIHTNTRAEVFDTQLNSNTETNTSNM